MKVLGVLLSPHRHGNSAALLEAFLQGATAGGAKTELVDFPKLDVGGCRGCNACKETRKCILDDDMQPLYEKVADADIIAQASPVYFDQVTAQAKTFLDRLYCFIGLNQERWMPEGKKGAYFLDWEAGPGMSYGKDLLDWWKGRFEYYFRIETAYTLGVDSTGKNPVSERKDLLATIREAGEKLARGEALA